MEVLGDGFKRGESRNMINLLIDISCQTINPVLTMVHCIVKKNISNNHFVDIGAALVDERDEFLIGMVPSPEINRGCVAMVCD